ncbi:PAS domain-containing sensor histidine kinase [Desulfurispirillum indicum]|uniref:PAS domain-containing sensor histidine kinase n=1 Tax=Desulfurispirillum indicum TaxID=936456 RepID=UPI001CFB1E2D|nr:PAS domain-containing sensor histidine kinase [Desulfurispirillum indicum]UCZ55811.1 PAS domain-containing sensor histidine kinase [Desulfurispirillum indicum]
MISGETNNSRLRKYLPEHAWQALGRFFSKGKQRIRERNHALAGLLEALPEASFAYIAQNCHKPGNLVAINGPACELFASSQEQLLSLSPLDLCHPHYSARFHVDITECPCATRDFEAELRRADGNSFRGAVRIRRIRMDGQSIAIAIVKTLHDSVPWEQQQGVLQQSKMAQIGSMMGAVAHQWKQPLNNLAILAQCLPRDAERVSWDGRSIESTVADILKHVEFMNRTLDDFRDFFRPQAQSEYFEVGESITAVIALMREQLRYDDVDVLLEPSQPFHVAGVRNHFQQVILNILNNARQAFLERGIPARRRITVSINSGEQHALITLRDNAGGIPRHLLPDALFQPYVTTKEHDETGIGLSLSRTIIEQMGGTISACNSGHGACFHLRLPLRRKDAAELSASTLFR